MERFQETRDFAVKHYKTADHMLFMTYPLVKDPKLLLAVTDNVFLALKNSMASILYHDRIFKRIPIFQDNFESMFNMFRYKSALLNKVDKEYITLIQDIHEIIQEHKKSPVEFSRKDSYIICSKDYEFKTISTNKLKDYLLKTKKFLRLMESIVSKNERIFTQR